MGARAVPAKSAPMPRMAYSSGVWATFGTSRCTTSPKAPPSAAPISSEGPKAPPEPPEPIVTEVATSLSATTSKSAAAAVSPLTAASSASWLSPSTRRSASASAPTASPPSAGRSSAGTGSRAKRSSLQ